MECKYEGEAIENDLIYIKIETYWNVNYTLNAIPVSSDGIKIETYWNVNTFFPPHALSTY